MKRLLLSGAVAAALSGCAHGAPPGMDVFFPLRVGNAWSYQMDGSHGEQKLEFKIVGKKHADDGTRYLLDPQGSHYYLRDGQRIAISVSPGIWTVFLESPLALGKRFDGGRVMDDDPDAGGRIDPIRSAGYKIVTGLDRTIRVAAGTFRDCLEVTQLAGPIISVKYYAPKVGLVLSEGWLERGGVRSRFARQELVSYQVEPTEP